MRILVFNCGSSSLKFELVELDAAARRTGDPIRGEVENIGSHANYTFHRADSEAARGSAELRTHQDAARHALNWLRSVDPGLPSRLAGVAHRVVHGGAGITQPVRIDQQVLDAIGKAAVFAPLHNPPVLATIQAVTAELSGVPSVAVADTAFHQSIPPQASTYAIPRPLAQRHGIRRFGFHGIGHAYMMERYAELIGKPAAQLDLITLQLGAGCSAAAIAKGRSVDTSMGLTPLEGLVMATRCGDLDPAIVSFIAQREALSPGEVERILNAESGLLGVSGCSADLREVQAAAARGDQNASLAIEVFCYRVRKYIGAYLAVLGRADAIIFGGGIGEHADSIRERICAGLSGIGIVLDAARNREANGREYRISAGDSTLELWVIALDEELQMARAAARVLGLAKTTATSGPGDRVG